MAYRHTERNDMPHKRDPEKKMIGFWLSPRELRELDELCRRLDTNRAELFRKLVGHQANPLGKKVN
jgi:hypothetical protein